MSTQIPPVPAPTSFARHPQLFFDVWVMKVPSWGVTFVPLHVGHWILAFSLSEIVMISSNGLSHFSHINSYLGMTTLVAGSAYSPRRTGSVNVNVDPCPT